MRMDLLVVSAALVYASVGAAYGQAREPKMRATVSALRTGQAGTIVCSSYLERCVVPVYVVRKGDLGCLVFAEFSRVEVERSGTKTRIVWRLEEGEIGDRSDYRFTTSGVDILRNTADDFDQNAHEVEVRRFRWRSVHTRTDVPLDYAINAERSVDSGATWTRCDPIDPIIVNRP